MQKAMRRLDESQDSDFKRYVKIGEDNAECLSQMRRWCKHVEIERTSEGLYAQMTGLPIASHSLGCPKIEGKSESMNLHWIFSEFLVQHCATCPHHAPNGDTSWGQEIIAHHQAEVREREQAAEEEADRISKLRSELRLESRDIGAEADPEFYRILEYFESIFSEDEAERDEASKRLKQSAHLGAELFPDAAINLISLLAGSDEFSELMLPVCAELANGRSDLDSRLSQMALDNIEKGLYPELSASVLDALGDGAGYPLSEVCIKRLLLSQYHYYPIGEGKDREPDYSHSTAVIVRSFDADPDSIQTIVRRELQNESDGVRFQLCGAIKLIQNEQPQIAENLLGDLVHSLELYEDGRMSQTPSGQIVHILQSAFRYSVEKVDQFLAESMARVRPAVQEDIVRVYRDQFFDQTTRWEERREQRNRVEVSEQEKAAILRLLSWAKDDWFEIDIRAHAVEALEMACTYATAGMLSHFDSILGYFAILSGEEHPPDPPPKILLPEQPQSTQLEQLDEFRRTQEWSTFKHRLQTCLKELCKAKPSEVFDSVYGCLTQTPVHLEDGFNACCVSLLGELGKDYLLQPRVLPLVWRALMDYGSALVRAEAIRAAVEMFSSSTTSPPANLVDTIIVHLQDPKVVVHQAALRAVSRRPIWFDERQATEALTCLNAHLRVYQDDKYQLDDICDGILAIGRRYERLKLPALRLVESAFPTGEDLVDRKIAEKLAQFCNPNERIAEFVAKDIGTHLAHHSRDQYNYYGYSERLRMFEWLHQLPASTYQRIADDLLASAREVAKRDAWESCHFASLFARFRAFRCEQSVLEAATNALPEEPRYETFRTSLQRLAMIAARNASLEAGDTAVAKAFAKGKDET